MKSFVINVGMDPTRSITVDIISNLCVEMTCFDKKFLYEFERAPDQLHITINPDGVIVGGEMKVREEFEITRCPGRVPSIDTVRVEDRPNHRFDWAKRFRE